jgi:hypothetical protein
MSVFCFDHNREVAMAFDTVSASDYVKGLDLRGTPRGIVHQDAAEEAGEVFNKAKAQAQVVGSSLFSFAQGVDVPVREAISDSALLAQLVANKRRDIETDTVGWFKEYSAVLSNLGWTLQDYAFNDYTTKGEAAEVHEKIIEVLKVVLGPAPAALTILTAAITTLKGMKPDSSWLTIFERNSKKAKMARFQIGLVEAAQDGDVFVTLLACVIHAKDELTQVLVFKWRKAKATFEAQSQKVSINRAALTDLGPAIRAKTRAYQTDYLGSIQDI